MKRRRGVFPGSFNPPTHAHIAIAAEARKCHGLDVVDLCLSRVTLAKEHVVRPTIDERAAVLRLVADQHGWLGVKVTDASLLAEIATGYDVVIMGADKWHQIHDPAFYRTPEDRDAAIASLPAPAIVPRDGLHVPARHRLELDAEYASVSSTAARRGRRDWMLPEARESGLWDDREDDGG